MSLFLVCHISNVPYKMYHQLVLFLAPFPPTMANKSMQSLTSLFLTPSTILWPLILTPLSSRLSNSSLILRSCRPYFLAAHKAGGADLDRPLNGAPSVGVPASSSPLAWSSSSLDTLEAWDSEFTLIRPVPTWARQRWEEFVMLHMSRIGGTQDTGKGSNKDTQ